MGLESRKACINIPHSVLLQKRGSRAQTLSRCSSAHTLLLLLGEPVHGMKA